MRKSMMMLVAAATLAGIASAQAPTIPPAEKEAIIKTALDYGDGFYSAAAERMERAIHPDLNKLYVTPIPQTGKMTVRYSTYTGLIELTRAKAGFVEPEKRKIQGYALAVNGDFACAKVTSAMFDDFLSMVKVDGQWKIVNVLWVPGPDTPNRPPVPAVDAVKDKDAVRGAANDFITGVLSGDAALLERVLHPEVSMAAVITMPTGRSMINRVRYSGLVEAARAKLGVAPEGARTVDIRIIDVMDGMAFVEVANANLVMHVQMTVLDGQWKIFNVLARRTAPSR